MNSISALRMAIERTEERVITLDLRLLGSYISEKYVSTFKPVRCSCPSVPCTVDRLSIYSSPQKLLRY